MTPDIPPTITASVERVEQLEWMAGVARVQINLKMDVNDLALWSPVRIDRFFGGLAQALEAYHAEPATPGKEKP